MKTMLLRLLCAAGLAIAAATSAAAIEITDKLMTTGFKSGRGAGDPIDTVLIHFSSNVKANKTDPYDVDAVIALFAASNSSAHYLIDRAGKIFRLVKESDTAYHAGKGEWEGRKDTLNRFSIGVELLAIGSAKEMKAMIGMTAEEYAQIPEAHRGYAAAQYTALASLLKDIETRNGAIKHDRKHIIGHDEYAPDRKQDPGSLFDWSKLGF